MSEEGGGGSHACNLTHSSHNTYHCITDIGLCPTEKKSTKKLNLSENVNGFHYKYHYKPSTFNH